MLHKKNIQFSALLVTMGFILSNIEISNGLVSVYGKPKTYYATNFVGDPLFVTPLIESGNITMAQKMASVYPPLKGTVKSYAGYFTVDKKLNSNLFFWFFPSESNDETAPLILWLQGGPGATSMFGLFEEHGPFYIKKGGMELVLRKYSWTKTVSVLYIDNPVGTGYSFTEHDEGYARNEDDVANNLYESLQQFFKMFPSLQSRNFYVTGESYAGKYVPAISYMIHKMNPTADIKINLKGMAIGNGLCDPKNMLMYGEYLYEIGLIDVNGKTLFENVQSDILSDIEGQRWFDAFQKFDSLLNGDMLSVPSVFTNLTGFTNYYNYLSSHGNNAFGNLYEYIQKDRVRESIHVGNLTFHTDQKVEEYLREDVMKTVVEWIQVLIEHYEILIYSGQLDIIVSYPLTLSFLQNLSWSKSEEYKVAPRYIWKLANNRIAGYVKTVGNLKEVLVRDAGHMVPMDQPLVAFDLINRFVYGKAFN